jgi:hypothetical protein
MRSSNLDANAAGGQDAPLPLDDIQGLVLRGYSYPYIPHFIFRISDGSEAAAEVRGFIAALLPSPDAPEPALCITSAQPWSVPPPCCVNLGLTASGLRTLLGDICYQAVSTNTSREVFGPFDAGAAAPASAIQVGDTGTSAPANWWQNGNWKLPTPPSSDGLDLVVSLYATTSADRDRFGTMLLVLIPTGTGGEPALPAAFVQDADPLLDGAGDPSTVIHFGYRDGISQPRIAGTPWDDPGDPDDDSPLVPAWHFVLNPDNPSYNVDPLLVNGCFGAFRLLYQDVGAFESFLTFGGDPALLAAKMCGRWRDGTPLEVSPKGPDSTLSELDLINFSYLTPTPHQKGPRQPDGLGAQCPYAAHTRRTNPRDDDDVQGNINNAVQHRIRRFATPYGPPYTPASADAQRGLVGWFMGANLTDQFEFLMNTWISTSGFRPGNDASPNASGVDPLFGPQKEDVFHGDFEFDYLGGSGTYQKCPGLQRFIRTDGGLYAFLPSLTALRTLSAGIKEGACP